MDFIKGVFNTYIERGDWFLGLIGEHLAISFISIILAVAIGLLLGIWISERDRIATIVLGIANMLYTIPSISLLGMLIPFLGIGNKTAIVALTIYGIMPMVRNTYAGIKNVNKETVVAAVGMGSTDLQVMTRIKIPMALSVIVAGVRNVVVMTISVAAIASFIGAGGLGVAIYRGITIYNPELTFAGGFLIALLALALDFLLGIVEKQIKKRRM